MTGDQLRALIPDGWRAAIDGTVPKTDFEQLARRLDEEQRDILPADVQWFRALEVTPLTAVRAVILGQDPYPTEGQAEGLAFSVPDGQEAPRGLPGPGILDWDYYGSLIPQRVFEEMDTPAETVAATFATGHNAYVSGYHCGLLLAAYPLGSGRIILNTFPVIENLDRNPVADRLFLNMVTWLGDDGSGGRSAR